MEDDVEIGPDGIVEIKIDTSIAKAAHGDQDHNYSITAEVVDQSRRTIVGSGSVLVAREPFKVFVWPNQGHFMPPLAQIPPGRTPPEPLPHHNKFKIHDSLEENRVLVYSLLVYWSH